MSIWLILGCIALLIGEQIFERTHKELFEEMDEIMKHLDD